MQVFKAYFKVIKKNLPQMTIYLIIFLGLSIAFTVFAPSQMPGGFTQTKINVAVINQDASSPLAQGLAAYLEENATVADIKDKGDNLQDALFFRRIEYIARIPPGFSEAFLSGDPGARIERTAVPDSASAMQADLMIGRYLDLAGSYAAALPDMTQPQIAARVAQDLARRADVAYIAETAKIRPGGIYYYYLYYAYSVMAIVVLGVTSIMLVFNQSDLKKRNLASPVKILSINLQLMLGNFAFSLIVWIALCLFGFFLYRGEMNRFNAVLIMANALIYTVVCLSVSFLIGYLIKNKNAQAAITNVLSLGMCFVSGVFVEQEFLGDTVNGIARFLPTYWYVRALGGLEWAPSLSWDSLSPSVYAMLLQLGFAVACFAVALAVARHKSVEIGA